MPNLLRNLKLAPKEGITGIDFLMAVHFDQEFDLESKRKTVSRQHNNILKEYETKIGKIMKRSSFINATFNTLEGYVFIKEKEFSNHIRISIAKQMFDFVEIGEMYIEGDSRTDYGYEDDEDQEYYEEEGDGY